MKPISRAIQPNSKRVNHARIAFTVAAAASALALCASAAHGQRRARADAEPESLHGSKESVEKMYDFALNHHMPFYLTPTNVDDAVAKGRLVALTGDSTYELTRGVGFAYATPQVKQFVEELAPQYLYACGAPLTVTSAARPKTNQPHNANPHSVHPTGIAVDLRRPFAGPCLNWIRNSLATLEAKGIVEATEEHHPVHLHIAVLAAPGARVVLPNLIKGVAMAPRVPATQLASSAGAPAQFSFAAASGGEVALPPRTYVVRPGDTIFDIAGKAGVSVATLQKANRLSPSAVLKPGTALTLPPAERSERGR